MSSPTTCVQLFKVQFLPKYCHTNPNTVQLYNLFTFKNINILNRLCKFINELVSYFKIVYSLL